MTKGVVSLFFFLVGWLFFMSDPNQPYQHKKFVLHTEATLVKAPLAQELPRRANNLRNTKS